VRARRGRPGGSRCLHLLSSRAEAPRPGFVLRGERQRGRGGVMPVSNDELKGLYYYANLGRQVDERCPRLFKQGRLHGTYFSAVGQEGTVVGPCYGLRPDDVIGIQHREIGAVITKGLPIRYLMAQLFARKDSPDRGKSHPCHYGWKPAGIITPASTIAAQTVIATPSPLASNS